MTTTKFNLLRLYFPLSSLLLLLILPLSISSSISLKSGLLVLSIADDGSEYNISISDRIWFNSGDSFFSANAKKFSLSSGDLVLVTTHKSTGSDKAGTFNEISFQWAMKSKGTSSKLEVSWVTSFKAYDNRNAIVFQQKFPTVLTDTKGSRFPSLKQSPNNNLDLGTLEYTGESCGFMVAAHGKYPGISGGGGNGMIVVTPRDINGGGSSSSLVIGPVTEHFANQASGDSDAISYGVASSFEFIPKDYVIETVLVLSSSAKNFVSPGMNSPERASIPSGGVNAGLAEYGDFVLSRHGKSRAIGNHTTETTYLGYSTTGFYFYNLCDCQDPMKEDTHRRTHCTDSPITGCHTYEDTLIAVDSSLKRRGIPYHHMLLDSWWYGENLHGGVWMWEDLPAVVQNVSFQSGLSDFWKRIGKDKVIWAHNGKWEKTPYAKEYPFTPDGSLPQGDALWQHLFRANKKWGLQTIKQDHMSENMGSCKQAYKNVSVLKSWLKGMGEGASNNSVGILYCCAHPSVHMNGVTVPSAYSVRASPDYVWQTHGRVLHLPQLQWAIGPDSAFHWIGLGLLPYKDTFFSNKTMMQTAGTWTNDTKQWPPFHGYAESNPLTHALMSVLSTASVTFSDAVDATNKTLIMMTCREDGMILKPDRPATAIDAQFQAMLFHAWPGGVPTPSPMHGTLNSKPCQQGNPRQIWSFDNVSGTLSITEDSPHGCVDISKCSTTENSPTVLFNNTAGCGHGPGTCDGHNELWSFEIQHDMLISRMNNKCLSANDKGAWMKTCNSEDPTQKWSFTQNSSTKTWQILQKSKEDLKCLTGGVIKREKNIQVSTNERKDAVITELESLMSDHGLTDGLSSGYARAIRSSANFAANLAHRSRNTQCTELAAPQGPLGEIYSTHTTINKLTWFYVVGIQISKEYSVSPNDLQNSIEWINIPDLVTFRWSNTDTFKPRISSAIKIFNTNNPLLFTPDSNSDNGLYPIQYYTIAPVLSNGMILLGETRKLVPISSQRIKDLKISSTQLIVTVSGVAGEDIEFGVIISFGDNPTYLSCVVPSSGEVQFIFPNPTCKSIV